MADDWVGIYVTGDNLPDPFINTVFKTELITHLKKLNTSITVKVGPTIEYQKKPGKLHVVKSKISESAPKYGDIYKSSTISVRKGLPPNSKQKPRPKRMSTLSGDTGSNNRYSNSRQSQPQPQSKPRYQQPVATQQQYIPQAQKKKANPPPPPSANQGSQNTCLLYTSRCV